MNIRGTTRVWGFDFETKNANKPLRTDIRYSHRYGDSKDCGSSANENTISIFTEKGNVTNNGVTEKEQTIQDIIWGVGSETLYQKNRAEYETGPDSIK